MVKPPKLKNWHCPQCPMEIGKVNLGTRARVWPPTLHHPCKAALQAPTVGSALLETLASVGQLMDQHCSEG